MLATTKDLAVELQLHPRTVKRWWKKLGVPPDACTGNGCHRWTPEAVASLKRKWREWWTMRGHSPEVQSQKFTGSLIDKKQIEINFNGKAPYKILSPAKWEKERQVKAPTKDPKAIRGVTTARSCPGNKSRV